MKQITINLYNYNELDEKGKEKVKECYFDILDPDEFTTMVLDELESMFPRSELKIEYRLSYCQGDGLNIYGKLNINDVLDRYEFTEKEKRTLKTYCYHTSDNVVIPSNKHGYTYCYSDYISFDNDVRLELESMGYRDIKYGLLLRVNDDIRRDMRKLCDKYEELGYNYFYEISDTELSEWCNDNGHMFTKDGSIYY